MNSFKGQLNGLSEKGCLDGMIGWVEVHKDDVFDRCIVHINSNCLELCMAMKSLLNKYVNGFVGVMLTAVEFLLESNLTAKV